MKRSEIREWVEQTKGAEFTVEFIKRSDNSLRVMSCHTGATDALSDDPHAKRAYDPKSYKLITVYSIVDKGYRSIPLEGVIRIKVAGEWVTIVEG